MRLLITKSITMNIRMTQKMKFVSHQRFLMQMTTDGNNFSFMGNQYRLVVSEKEYFIDLLFLWCAANIKDIRNRTEC